MALFCGWGVDVTTAADRDAALAVAWIPPTADAVCLRDVSKRIPICKALRFEYFY